MKSDSKKLLGRIVSTLSEQAVPRKPYKTAGKMAELDDNIRDWRAASRRIGEIQAAIKIQQNYAKAEDAKREQKATEIIAMLNMFEMTTREVDQGVVVLEQIEKYGRVQPSYKALYEQAITKLREVNQAAAEAIEAAAQLEVSAKNAETKIQLSDKPLKAEGVGEVVGSFWNKLKSMAVSLMSKIHMMVVKADEFTALTEKLQSEMAMQNQAGPGKITGL